MASRTKGTIGILTAGGDCPGLNAAIRGVAKAAMHHGMRVVGVQDGFRGLVENRVIPIDDTMVSGILTQGGTFLGSSRDKPHKMTVDGETRDMTESAVRTYKKNKLDCLVCLGGNGTQKNAYRLHQNGGINVLTLPKTIDNDIAETDITFGFDSAVSIATEAIDRLHTTATSHHRIIVCEMMGHDSGWLCLAAGIAGGADVILIPEIPYNVEAIVRSIAARRKAGKRFSIIAVAEGITPHDAHTPPPSVAPARKGSPRRDEDQRVHLQGDIPGGETLFYEPVASRLAREIQRATSIEARVTSLGHVQRGGTPTAFDRIMCTRLGTKAVDLLAQGRFNVMVAIRGTECVPVPLPKVAGVKRVVPLDHPWVRAARLVGTCMGDV